MRWGYLLVLIALAGCIPKVERPSTPTVRSPATVIQREPARGILQCHADLRREGVGFKILPDRVFAGDCSALGSVQLTEIGTPVTNLGAMTCPLARQFTRWTREAVQPAAQRWLGSRVVRIESFGTYSCRPVNGQSGNKLSEHGLANAVDTAVFVLADERRISVLDGWQSDDDDTRAFLRDIHQAACRRFGVVLGPDANAYHRNHFHFDMGRGPYCR